MTIFFSICNRCLKSFCDERQFQKHITTCGKMQVAPKSVRTGRPKKAQNTALKSKLPANADNEEPLLPPSEAESDAGQSEQDGSATDQLPRRPGRPRKKE